MAAVEPFRGLVYVPEVVGDLAAVTAPPYDAIDPAAQERLYAASAYNVVRLELGRDLTGDDDRSNRYTRAAHQLRAWTEQGALRLDPHPALYVYAQRFRQGGSERSQLGVLAAIEAGPWSPRGVLPHERVYPAAGDDRLRLLRALEANVSPVFVLTDSEPPSLAAVLDAAAATPPDAAFTDEEGVEHRTWRVVDPDVHREVGAGLAGGTLLMADGHHRYTTAAAYREETGAPGADRVLAYVVPAGRGTVIRAMHRVVHELPADHVARMRAAGWEVRDAGTDLDGVSSSAAGDLDGVSSSAAGDLAIVSSSAASDLAIVLAGLGRDTEAAFGFVSQQGAFLLAAPAGGGVPAGVPPELARLDAVRLDHLLAEVLGVKGGVDPTPDAEGGIRAVAAGDAAALVVTRPVDLDDVWRVARAGYRMPPKSTSFHPKPRTGLALRPLAAADAGLR